MQTNKITPDMLAKYSVYVKIKPDFLKNLRKSTLNKKMRLEKRSLADKLTADIWEVTSINSDESSKFTGSLVIKHLAELIGRDFLIFEDEVFIVKIERRGGRLF